mgnify:CR=1 FL=1
MSFPVSHFRPLTSDGHLLLKMHFSYLQTVGNLLILGDMTLPPQYVLAAPWKRVVEGAQVRDSELIPASGECGTEVGNGADVANVFFHVILEDKPEVLDDIEIWDLRGPEKARNSGLSLQLFCLG